MRVETYSEHMSDSPWSLSRLKRQLERLEPRRAPASADHAVLGHAAIDAALGGGIGRGRLHELFVEQGDVGSGTGLAALFGLCVGQGKPLLWLRSEAMQKRSGHIHATGLNELGIDPANLLMVIAPDDAALLHASAEAARCRGLGAILVEAWGPMRALDLTATRRLMLALEASGTTLFIMRIDADPAPSAADTRWRVAAAPSIALEADAPGASLFEVELLRRRAGPPAGPWRLEWDRDRLCFRNPVDEGDARTVPAIAPLSGPVLPLVVGGKAEADPAPPLRRTG